MDLKDFSNLVTRFAETNVPFEETMKYTTKGLNDDDEKEMFSYLKKYILDVRIHLSEKPILVIFYSIRKNWQRNAARK